MPGSLTPSSLAGFAVLPRPFPLDPGGGAALFRTTNLMALYRCHFLDAHDHIEAHEEVEAGSFFDAVQRANAMLDQRSHHDAVEIWAGDRWLYRAGREKGAYTLSFH
jgi:hypothetical protein